MIIYFSYALVLGIILSLIVFTGCVIGNRRFILGGMIFSAIIASPITSFTRGAPGAIFASDIVSFVLLVCWFLPNTQALLFKFTPKWYRCFFWLMILALVSVIFVAPFNIASITELGLSQRVHSHISGLPIFVLMAGFRVIRIILHLVFFTYACHMLVDEKLLKFVYKIVVLSIVIVSVFQIIHFLGIKDVSFYLPYQESWSKYQSMHILGNSKMALGRLYLMGIFVCLILLYRSWSTLIYLIALCTITIALLFSESRAGLLGLLVGFAIFGLRSSFGGKAITCLLFGVIPIAFMVLFYINPRKIEPFTNILKDPFSNYRWIIWRSSISYQISNPHLFVTGLGFSNYSYAIGAKVHAEHAHNDFLTSLTEMGLLGMAMFLAFIYFLWREFNDRIKYIVGKFRWETLCMTAALGGLLITSLFENSFYYSSHLVCMQRLFAVLFGSSSAWWVQQEYSKNEKYVDSESDLDKKYFVAMS